LRALGDELPVHFGQLAGALGDILLELLVERTQLELCAAHAQQRVDYGSKLLRFDRLDEI
jgi:hypothetical protein